MKQLKIIIVALLITQFSFAQKKDENIGTEVVNVVKPYTPTISDAFKVKETPTLDDDETSKKENIKYNIFSFPVASTFAPSKGRAANVDKSPDEKIFSNYLTLAAGNYGTANAELFVTENVSNTDYFGGMLRHASSQGGIKNVELDDKFSNTALDLTYGSRTRILSWNVDAGYQRQIYNWYGIIPNYFDQALINVIDEQQTYQNLYLGGRINLGDSFFKESTIKFNRFSDAFGSVENRFIAKPSLAFAIEKEKIKVDFIIDHLRGSFEKSFNGGGIVEHGFTNFGMQPSVVINKDDLSVNAGVGLFYSSALTNGVSKFYIYPQVTGSYKVVGDLMIAYAGIEGSLRPNSYKEFVDQNFFVSPTLVVSPTDQKYDIYVGLKGKLANSVSYNVRGSYLNENNKALFKSNGFDNSNANTDGYIFGNSFGVVYDNVKTISFFGELKADFSKNVSFGVNGTFSSYSMDVQKEAWNLPALQVGANLDVTISSKWYSGLSLFFVGERNDQFVDNPFSTNATFDVTLKSYFDLNAHVGYKHSERMTFFIKGNNLANQNYQRWLNYPVQGIQILGGASYKFDF